MKPFLQLVLFVVLAAASLQAQTGDEAIVRQFFPQSLIADTDPGEATQSFDYVRADLDGTGRADYIAAVYYNGSHDVLRILRVQNGIGSVAYDPDFLPPLGYRAGHVKAVDLNGDGRAEIILDVPTEIRSTSWVFSWNNGALSIASPVKRNHRGRVATLFGPIEIADVDGDGIPEVLHWERAEGTSTYAVYKLAGSTLARTGERISLLQHLVRTSGDPDDFDFGVHVDASGPYTLRIVNGNAQGQNRVTSAEVDVNDDVIVPESAFKKAVGVLTYTVSLGEDNEIFVELRSAPGSELTLIVANKH